MAAPKGKEEKDKKANDIIYIYSIKHPVTNEIRYIGKAKNINSRLRGHIKNSKNNNTHFYNWIKSITNLGLLPIIEVIKESSEANWCQDEIMSIKEYRDNGYNLLNIADGGNEPFCSKEQRAINGRNNALKIHSDITKKKLWYLRQQMGISLKLLYKNGMTERADEMIKVLATRGIYFNIK